MNGNGAARPAGDAWEELVTSHAAAVFRLAARLIGKRDGADELVLSTFCRLRSESGEGSAPDADRAARLRRIVVQLYLARFVESDRDRRPDAAAWDTPVERALAALPPQLRTVAVLHDMERIAATDVAQLLHVDVATIYRLLRRARTRIAQIVEGRPRRESYGPGA